MKYFQSEIEKLLYLLVILVLLSAVGIGLLAYQNARLVQAEQVTIINNEKKLNENNEEYIRCVVFSFAQTTPAQIESSINTCLATGTQGLQGSNK